VLGVPQALARIRGGRTIAVHGDDGRVELVE
jgi:hypothetical protein